MNTLRDLYWDLKIKAKMVVERRRTARTEDCLENRMYRGIEQAEDLMCTLIAKIEE